MTRSGEHWYQQSGTKRCIVFIPRPRLAASHLLWVFHVGFVDLKGMRKILFHPWIWIECPFGDELSNPLMGGLLQQFFGGPCHDANDIVPVIWLFNMHRYFL